VLIVKPSATAHTIHELFAAAIDELRFRGWGCSECAWVVNPSGSPIGISLAEMKENYERQRDKDFAAHLCAERARAKKTKLIARVAPGRTSRVARLQRGPFPSNPPPSAPGSTAQRCYRERDFCYVNGGSSEFAAIQLFLLTPYTDACTP
jgi:hypothetical protein